MAYLSQSVYRGMVPLLISGVRLLQLKSLEAGSPRALSVRIDELWVSG